VACCLLFFSREICDERTGDASLEIGSGLLAHVATIGRFKADGDNARPAAAIVLVEVNIT